MKRIKFFLTFFIVFLLLSVKSVLPQNEKLKQALKKIKKEGCVYGIFMHNLPVRLHRINHFDLNIGKKPGQIMFFMNWEMPFPDRDMQEIVRYGAVPHIVWEPNAYINGKECLFLKNIIDGECDAYLKRWAKEAALFSFPFILRLGHEMDGNWYPWSGARNGNAPEQYVKMWRHVYRIFQEAGAENVIWAWTPVNTNVLKGEEWNEFYHYYPGDEYVDWIGMDGYNWGSTQPWSRWQSFVSLFNDRYYEMIQRYPGKPMMIGEFASAVKGGNKPQWIKETFEELKKYPAIKAFVWFNINKECDWRIHSDEDSLKSFSRSMKDEYYLSNAEDLRHYFKNIEFPETSMNELRDIPKDIWDKKPETTIYWTEKKLPEIDGSLEEWPTGSFVHLRKDNLVIETNEWHGNEDLSGKAAILLSPEHMYIAFEIKDDHPFINLQKNEFIWNGDSLEIAFNFNTGCDLHRIAMSEDDFQVAFGIDKKKITVWSWQLKRELSEAEAKVRKNENGYVLEARIPYDVFGLKHIPKPGIRIAVNFAINDADSEIREHQMVWSGDQLFYKDPSVWGMADVELMQ